MAKAGEDSTLDVRDLDFELLRRAFLTLAQGHLVATGEEGRDFLRGLAASLQEVVATIEPGRLDAQASSTFDRAAARVQAVLQEALQGTGLD